MDQKSYDRKAYSIAYEFLLGLDVPGVTEELIDKYLHWAENADRPTTFKSQQYSGPYTITFDREPNAGSVTFATISIRPRESDPIVLSRVNFGLHNGINIKEGIVLRIDKEPHGVMKRTN